MPVCARTSFSNGCAGCSKLWPLTTVEIAVDNAVDKFVDYSEVQCGCRTWRHCAKGAEEEFATRATAAIRAVSRETFTCLEP